MSGWAAAWSPVSSSRSSSARASSAHLDVAGPAFHEGAPFGYTPKGGTGTAVRTLVRLAERTAAGDLG
ncbi:hypothetical protein SALBM135S_00333 [Streptomyces alboniger]